MSAIPIYVIPDRKQVDWTDSIDRCTLKGNRDREHGHKLPYREGDQVKYKDGRIGVLVHKEFLRYDAELNREVWQLIVQYGARRENYSDPSVLSVPTAKQRLVTQKWADPVA